MTRLIDADKLPNIYTATHQEMIMSFEEAPTVKAIPVEWIRKYTEENRLYQSDDFGLYISDMIADWAERKEE